ncbi:hypothetical protein [Massilia varians]|uniref:hypothetical protein n=1 Tax=Massilia varians TaxID=457921 RepID=UPI0025562C97|nr:hypothetical protein [Massilia varians]MDK6079668.1 hypothetical protein [Massilia varians]
MEELRMIVEMVAKLPQTALWVMIGFWAYKVMIVGSIYGVIRFVVSKTHDYLVTRKVVPPEVKQIEVRVLVDGICIGDAVDPLMNQLRRLVGMKTGIKTTYVHRQSVDWLREAIDEKLERERMAGIDQHRSPISP